MKRYTLKIYWVLYFIAVFSVIYFYLLPYKTSVIYSDDLFLYIKYHRLSGLWEKLNLSRHFNQIRPVRDLVVHLQILVLDKNMSGYYIFNIGILAINALIFARILNIFLKNGLLSVICGLVLGLSRFSYYLATQLYDGGALEGIALLFFLLSLCHLMMVLYKHKKESDKYRDMLMSILYANLSMYTHERYIVMFAFVLLIIVFYPSTKAFPTKKKIALAAISMVSIMVPFLLKYLIGIRVFMGTGGADITFTLASIFALIKEAILGVVQISTSPSYLSAMPLSAMPDSNKVAVALVACGVVVILLLYVKRMYSAYLLTRMVLIRIKIARVRHRYATRQSERNNHFYIVFFLFFLFYLLLVPAVVTIRMELRFLLAPFIVLILIIAIATDFLLRKHPMQKWLLLSGLTLIFVYNDYTYLKLGSKNLYYTSTDNAAVAFHKAMQDGVLKPEAQNLYIWERQKNPDRENEVNWVTASGDIFEAYWGKSKKYNYIDSLYEKSDSGFSYVFANLNLTTDQIIFLNIENNGESFKYSITDLSGEFRKDSLKSFAASMLPQY